MIRQLAIILATLCLILAMAGAGHAQDATAPAAAGTGELRVVTRQIAPFVIKDGDTYRGFSVDLWAAIAKELGRPFHFVEKGNVKEVLAAVKGGEGDVAIAAISITAEREDQFEFSHPMFESGLQIMIRNEQTGGGSFWGQARPLLTSTGTLTVLGIFAALIVIPAHVGWFVERRKENHLFPPQYFPGIFHAMYWATGAAAGQQPDPLYSGFGRVLSTGLIIGSLFFTSYFTAAITTALTVQQLKGDINGPEDLPGRKVGTTKGSTAATFLSGINAVPVEFSRIEDAFSALEAKNIDAVVFDAPVLLYYAANKGAGKVRIAGSMLKKENYGIMFPQGSDLRKPVNEALLKLRENGTYDTLYNKWFSAGSVTGQ
jgi:polar amino acid transport system substrate-binding protein